MTTLASASRLPPRNASARHLGVIKNTLSQHLRAGDEEAVYRPNPDALVTEADDADAAPNGVYRPPKLTPMAMEEPKKRGRALQDERRQRAAHRSAVNNQFVRDLEAEIGGAPEEVRQAGTGVGDSLAFLKEKQKLEARARVEEDLMARCPLD